MGGREKREGERHGFGNWRGGNRYPLGGEGALQKEREKKEPELGASSYTWAMEGKDGALVVMKTWRDTIGSERGKRKGRGATWTRFVPKTCSGGPK